MRSESHSWKLWTLFSLFLLFLKLLYTWTRLVRKLPHWTAVFSAALLSGRVLWLRWSPFSVFYESLTAGSRKMRAAGGRREGRRGEEERKEQLNCRQPSGLNNTLISIFRIQDESFSGICKYIYIQLYMWFYLSDCIRINLERPKIPNLYMLPDPPRQRFYSSWALCI